jgi:predicted enzyme related to lactoylglutathione lyase
MMATRDTPWPNGTPCWVDLAVDDIDAARLFYEGLFGWQIEVGSPEFGGYATCSKDGHRAAALMPKMSADQPSVWTTYLASDDADAAVARVTANGGQVLAEPMDVGDFGRMALALDPGGAVFGIWQSGSHTGAGVVNEPGSVIWNENMTRGWEANKTFYAAVFGWEYGDMSGDGFNYATFKVDGADVGGIGELPADAPADLPPNWSTYFAADNTDEAVDEVVKLGGNVVQPPRDTPFGRMAVVSDNQGSVFSLMSAPAAGYEAAGDAADA